MPFTAAELEEMRKADEGIDREFRMSREDLLSSRERDRAAAFEALPPEKRRNAEYQRAYREANREKLAEYQRAYREANREKIAEYQRAYREANLEKLAEYQRAYREANRERISESKRVYYEANREKVAEAQRWIRDARITHGYTQSDLSRMLGVSQPLICRLERGELRLDWSPRADKLCEILGGTLRG